MHLFTCCGKNHAKGGVLDGGIERHGSNDGDSLSLSKTQKRSTTQSPLRGVKKDNMKSIETAEKGSCVSPCSITISTITLPPTQLQGSVASSSLMDESYRYHDVGDDDSNDNMTMRNSVQTEDDIVDETFEKLLQDSNIVLAKMRRKWGVTSVSSFVADSEKDLSQSFLNMADTVLISQSWNKVLAFRSKFSEALVGRWRIIIAANELNKADVEGIQWQQQVSSPPFAGPSTKALALHMVENNLDPLAKLFGTRILDLDIIVVNFLDAAVRALCPRQQQINREAYRPLEGSADPDPAVCRSFFHDDQCRTFDDFCTIFAIYGVPPQFWLSFCEVFLWGMKGHNPYSIDDEKDDLQKATNNSAHGRFVTSMVALPMIEARIRRVSYVRSCLSRQLNCDSSSEHMVALYEHVENQVFKALFLDFPEISDHFSKADVKLMSFELSNMTNSIIQGHWNDLSDPESKLRGLLHAQSRKWIQLELPIEMIVLVWERLFESIELMYGGFKSVANSRGSCSFLFKEAMQFVIHPVLVLKNLKKDAAQFFEDVAAELKWPDQVLQKRLYQVFTEISTSGQYVQTAEELEIGCRLAWRNSAKCIGRIAWDTLVVRDCRHCTQPNEMFNALLEHVQMATSGKSIKSVMTVFRPQEASEIWGVRFWSSQFLRYAGYKENGSDDIIGDPVNAEFTSYLIKEKLWTPPPQKGPFDVLPVVLKIPGNDLPLVYELPQTSVNEVPIEHPHFPEVKELGYKWSAIPAISNFSLNLGGIKYSCAPFNGWFVTTEIVRNLLERYDAAKPLARAMGLDLEDKFLPLKVSAELESAVLYSFEKRGITIVDPDTVGRSFVTHCRREQSTGRECPAQWSWIGGLVGPTNPAWHLEMRDFHVTPQFDYCCEQWKVLDLPFKSTENETIVDAKTSALVRDEGKRPIPIYTPKVLIAYGSETGTAEEIANSLARLMRACVPLVLTLNEFYDLMNRQLIQFTHIMIICSSFGEGQPPTNANKFFCEEIKGKIPDHSFFSVLALGSSLYLENYCKAGKAIQQKMEDAGARPINNITCVDAAQGIQSTATSWCSRMKEIILSVSEEKPAHTPSISPVPPSYQIKWITKNAITIEVTPMVNISMCCIMNEELFKNGKIPCRSTRHIEFKLPDDSMYQTGDHLSVRPVNSIDMVRRFLACFAYDVEKAKETIGCDFIDIPCSIECVKNGRASRHPGEHLVNKSLKEVIGMHVDMALDAAPYVVDFLSNLLSKIEHETTSSREFRKIVEAAIEEYESGEPTKVSNFQSKYPTVVHFFERFGKLFCEPVAPNTQPILRLVDLLILMPRLKPRQYSISSSSITSPDTLSITAGVMNYHNSAGIKIEGVCSHYLANLKPGDAVNALVIKSSLRPPPSISNPIVMICAGTGLSPFMGFLKERASEMDAAQMPSRNRRLLACHLFYGCRSDEEILYEDELTKWHADGVVQVHVAKSRERGQPRQYVQDCLSDKSSGKEIASILLSKGAHVYICGDASMAKSCLEVCISNMQKHCNLSKLAASQHISRMRINGCWQFDVWDQAKEIDLGIKYTRRNSAELVKEYRRVLSRDF